MSAPTDREAYTRLPGRRRSLWNGGSLWMGSDHILLVRSAWMREEYRRFYLRDIQAIVVAPCPRYYVSGPMLLFAGVWSIAGIGAAAAGPRGMGVVWLVATLALLATWLSVSLMSSCRCRIFTAVSSEELPSLYRTWTARRFLAKVRPRIEQVQGHVDAGWEEAERSSMGPAVPSSGPEIPTAGLAAPFAGPGPAAFAPGPQLPGRTLFSNVFIASLFAGATLDYFTMLKASPMWTSVGMLVMLLELVSAVAVLVQYRKRQLRSGLQKVAVAAMILLGVMFYVQTFTYTMVTAQNLNVNGKPIVIPSPVVVIHTAEDIGLLVLGLIGAGLTLAAGGRGATAIMED